MDALSSRRDGLTRTRQLMQVENLGAPASPATLASSARGGGASASLVRAAKEGVKPASPLSSVPSPRAETDKYSPDAPGAGVSPWTATTPPLPIASRLPVGLGTGPGS